MQKNILVRSIAALSGIVMLASVAACGDNTATTTDNSSSSDSTSKSTPISGNFSGAVMKIFGERSNHLPKITFC